METILEVLSCGQYVKIHISGIVGMITAITLRFNDIIYEVSYYENYEHKNVICREQEFTPIEPKTEKIGFNRK